MREIDLSGLPIGDGNVNKNSINWNKSIGCKCKFVYDDIKGEVEIIGYKRNGQRIFFIYNDEKYNMKSCNFKKCQFGRMLGKITKEFKIKIGTKFGNGIVIDKKYKKDKRGIDCKYYLLKCLNCDDKRWMYENRLFIENYNCNKCGDGTSYPEKVMNCILRQLSSNYIYQLSNKNYEWCERYKYDFYLKDYNLIIETHGRQHYDIVDKFKRTLFKEQQENDKIKKELALKNGIDKYIVIDCRKSKLDWIKNNILNSELVQIYDLSNIDWNKVQEVALGNSIKDICKFYDNNSELTKKELATKFKLNISTVTKYLKQGYNMGWCKKYNTKHQYKRVLCIELNEEFESISECARKLSERFNKKFTLTCISNVCRGKQKTHQDFHFKYI